MHNFSQTVRRFLRDEDGAFITIFGLIAIVLVALSGAVVDYVTVEQARNRAQAALDAAALSLQPSIYTDTEDAIMAKAEALLTQQINNERIGVTMEEVDTDNDDGTLYLRARLKVPMTFVALVGVTEMNPVVVAEATRKKLFLEVAMVLDNSGSMAQESRMTNLKAAAKKATDIVMEYKDPADGGDGSVTDSTYVSIVPFNFWVNIGADKKDAVWMDQNGTSDASRDGFDTNISRFDLYDYLDVDWQGCVEARPQPYDANDAVPDASVPNTLFVPQFRPDEPDDGERDQTYNVPNSGRWKNSSGSSYYNYDNSYIDDTPPSCGPTATCEWTTNYYNCNWWGCGSSSSSYERTDINGNTTSGPGACSCVGESYISDTGWQTWWSGGNQNRTRTIVCEYTQLSELERQERICKYTNPISPAQGSQGGPNSDCISTELLPLTNSRDAVYSRINAMSSNGATNIHQGAIWGFHALSPTEPFTEGRDYETATYKVMILMTDGENTYYKYGGDTNNLNGASVYAPYGWPIYERLGDEDTSTWQMENLVDGRLLETCTNMKDAGIDIFTIGLEPPNEDVEDMLTACASDPSQAHFPDDSSELGTVFEDIARQLSDLRLAL